MGSMALEDQLLTESHNPHSASIDTLSPLQIVRLMNSEDLKVVEAIRAEAESIAQAIEWAADRLKRGGRLIYVGAGTSGRLGVLDAAECPPTFSTPPEMVVGLIAGGSTALVRAVEGAEDDPDRGAADIAALGVGPLDLVVGIATSGPNPIRPRRRARSTAAWRIDHRADLQSPQSARRRGRPRDRPARRCGGHLRIDAAEGGNRDQDDLEHDLHRSDGADRQDARPADGRPQADQREAADSQPPHASRAGGRGRRTSPRYPLAVRGTFETGPGGRTG